MESSIKQRIKYAIEHNNMSITALSRLLNIPQPTLNRQISGESALTENTINSFLNYFSDISAEWLLRGSGDMLKNSSGIIGSNNNIRYNSKGNGNINGSGNIGVGNTINVALPESGTQKIIRPDGGVEIINGDSNCEELDQLKKENDFLKSENSHFQSTMVLKDDLIASLRDTIELLKHKQ